MLGCFLWSHPLLIVILAFCFFSIGIWNARDGYGEDTTAISEAYEWIEYSTESTVPSHDSSAEGTLVSRNMGTPHSSKLPPVKSEVNVFVKSIALLLISGCRDPLTVALLMRIISSFLASVALYLVISSFSAHLSVGAILFASFVWIASAINAPFFYATSGSTFAFSFMLFGFYALLRSFSTIGIVWFYWFGLMAARIRPEYLQPVILVTIVLAVRTLSKGFASVRKNMRSPLLMTTTGLAVLAVAIAAFSVLRTDRNSSNRSIDQYLLFGLGQCYAAYYHRQHPDVIFDPMTEYQELLDKTFDKPSGFLDAVIKNPSELLRYVFRNGWRNFSTIPKEMFSIRSQGWGRERHTWRYRLIVCILAGGAIAAAVRIWRIGLFQRPKEWRNSLERSHGDLRGILLLCILATTPLVAILLLIPSPRYWISIVPLAYLLLAGCVEVLLRELAFPGLEALFVALSFVSYCSPNFIVPRPNYPVVALRRVLSLVSDKPVVGAWWPHPYCVFGFCGNAIPVGINDGIFAKDILTGRFDVFVIDRNFRESKTWASQRDFFETFEHEPEKFAFRKLDNTSTGSASIFYHQKPR